MTSNNLNDGTEIVGDFVGRDKNMVVTREAASPPAQLPTDISGFQGRRRELSELDRLLTQRDGMPPGVPRIGVITGTAGSGKTALAVHWAHSVVARFDSGHLCVNLYGYTPGRPPLRAVDALGQFLRALDVPATAIVDDEQECAARYRSETSGRSLLIVLDNVASVEQIRPLIPANKDCLVLVTSRECLPELVGGGALLIEVGPFSPADSRAMLARPLGRERVDAEPEAIARLAELCGHLPLALALASGRLVAAPGQRIAEYAEDLSAGDRLTELAAGDDPETTIRAAFAESFRALPIPERRLFGRLGLLPGHDFTALTAAAVNAGGLSQVRGLLRRLVAAHLVQPTTPGRYQLHDLLRLYAAERARDEADRDETEVRLLRWYLCAADAAGQTVNSDTVRLPREPVAAPGELPDFGTRNEAMAWLEAEIANLAAAVDRASDLGHHRLAYSLADSLRGFFVMRGYTPDWSRVASAGLRSARLSGDQCAEAALMHSLGLIDMFRSRYGPAVESFTDAVRLCERSGWVEGEAATTNSLATAYQRLGKLEQAAEVYDRTITMCRRAEMGAVEIGALNNLGMAHRALGRPHLAIRCCTEALARASEKKLSRVEVEARGNLGNALRDSGQTEEALAQLTIALEGSIKIGIRGIEASIRDSLAVTNHHLGRYDRSVADSRSALAINIQIEDPASQAANQVALAAADVATGRYRAAHRHCRRAIMLCEATGDRRCEVDARNAMGHAHTELRQHAKAAGSHELALAIAREVRYRYGEIDALCGIARAHRGHHDEQAMRECLHALELARVAGFRVLEAECLTVAAEIHFVHRRFGMAVHHGRLGLALHQGTSHRAGEIRTLRILGLSLLGAGRVGSAVGCWQHALQVPDAALVPERERIVALLRRNGLHGPDTSPPPAKDRRAIAEERDNDVVDETDDAGAHPRE